MKAITYLILVGVLMLSACTPSTQSKTTNDPIAPATATNTPIRIIVPPNGSLLTPNPAKPSPTPLPPELIPESLLITNLVPFTHNKTGISGLRPDNWTFFVGPDSFQFSSAPAAPDGFRGRLIPATEAELPAKLDTLWESLKSSKPHKSTPSILEENIAADGSGTILMQIVGQVQDSTKKFNLHLYANIAITPKGILVAQVVVPSELFSQEEELIRQMGDSLTIE